MIQINGTKLQVYVKVRTQENLDIITGTKGALTYAHEEGIISTVKLGMTGLGCRRIKNAYLPSEIQRTSIVRSLELYGKMKDIRDEMWSQACRYKFSSGLLIV